MLWAKEFGGGHKLYETMRGLEAQIEGRLSSQEIIEGKGVKKTGDKPTPQELASYQQAFEESKTLYNGAWEKSKARGQV
ncbi:MAG: hypothetical protein FJ271_28535 [Planctomycetes bacterium]|nr:hypothetical protein [Planctomycetota bacterium]